MLAAVKNHLSCWNPALKGGPTDDMELDTIQADSDRNIIDNQCSYYTSELRHSSILRMQRN